MKVPGFDLRSRPFLVLKTRDQIHIVNVMKKVAFPIINSFYEADMIRQFNMDIAVSDDFQK